MTKRIGIAVCIALCCASTTAVANSTCNTPVDYFTNPLYHAGPYGEFPLPHLAKQGVKRIDMWSCQDREGPRRCAEYGEKPSRSVSFDRSGRVIESDDGLFRSTYAYRGESRYPTATTQSSAYTPERTRTASEVDGEGVPVASTEWRRVSRRVVEYHREDGLVMSRYVDGRYESGIAYIQSLGGLEAVTIGGPRPSPLKDQYAVRCNVRKERGGVVIVEAQYTASLDGSRHSEAWRYDANGDLIWHRHPTLEIRSIPIRLDAKGNWLERRRQRPDGSALLEFRRIEYYD